MTSQELRKSLKKLGYSCKIRNQVSPFSSKTIPFVYLIINEKDFLISSSSVFPSEFYHQHQHAFQIVADFYKNL